MYVYIYIYIHMYAYADTYINMWVYMYICADLACADEVHSQHVRFQVPEHHCASHRHVALPAVLGGVVV